MIKYINNTNICVRREIIHFVNINLLYIRFLPEWTNIHLCQISEDHHTKEDGFKEDILLLKDVPDDKVHK